VLLLPVGVVRGAVNQLSFEGGQAVPEVVIVGAGIVGASIAYYATRRGAAVTLIDSGLPASGVTGGSFAWIGNSPGGWPGGSDDLRRHIMDDYRRLEIDLAEVQVRRTGSLSWTDEHSNAPNHDDAAGLGPERQVVGPSEITTLEPHLLTPPARAVHVPTDAGVDPTKVTHALVQAAGDHGARLLLEERVVSLDRRRGRVVGVCTATRRHPADTVVLAAGTAIPSLCAPLGLDVPVHESPALLLHAAAPAGMVKTIVATPDFEVREMSEGHLVITAPLGSDYGPPAVAKAAMRAVQRLAVTFEGGQDVHLLGHHLGRRPMPRDKAPIIGGYQSLPGLYLAVMHSALCLGPTVGRLVVDEILENQPVEQLVRCRLDRFDR
jgi:glycine/D-amino acid oxidase-like deaminating enzyme